MHNWQKFNVNKDVKVKLTPEGIKILIEKYNGEIPEWFENYYEGNGYYRFQLHDLMKTFGEYCYIGNSKLPFEMNIFIDINPGNI